MLKKQLLLSILVVQAFCGALYAQSSTRSSLEAKLALENSLEKRVRMVLAEALGTEDVIVIISAEMQEQEKKAAELMPGIPRQEKMGEPSLSSSLTMVKKISASLILDKSVSEDDTKLARKLAAGLLGLPPDRQDLVLIEKMDFRKAKPLTLSDLFVPPNLWSLVWIVVVSLLALFTVALFLAPLSKSARAFVEAFSAHNAAQAAAGGPAREERQEEVKETAAKAAEAQSAQPVDGRKPPFWFLGPAHLSSLVFIMKSRSVEDLTILLSYAPGDMPAKLSEALYPKSAEALAALPNVTLMPEARIRAFESELLSSLDYVVGGEDKALSILSGLDEAVQEKALAAFARLDPAMGKKLNAAIVRFSAITNLEAAQAQALTRRVPMRVLAAALKNSPYSAPFLAKLAGGMQERLQQELDLTRDLPAEAYKADRAKVVEALRQMIKEGFIALKSGGATRPAAAPAAAKPAGLAPLPGAAPAAKPAGL
ncbi:MAG: FliG C-terminal domain-containing protein, partial [Elusimicrobiales bacterium]|nr:FliG C-terminal domain-containing protein [Elusimicrobiales bacterium]